MRKLMIKIIIAILLSSIYINNPVVNAQTNEKAKVCALAKEKRVEEIVANIFGTYKEDDMVTRNEALICINQVVGLSDNAVLDTIVFLEYSDLYLYKDRINRLCSLSHYNYYTYEKTLFLEETTTGFWGKTGYCFYPTSKCTIEYAIELMANCIEKDYDNSVEVARKFNLCSADMLKNLDRNITVSELKLLMSNMLDVEGELYYHSDESGINNDILRTNETFNYYDLYCKRKTYVSEVIDIDDKKGIEVMKNKNGVCLIKLRDFLSKYNKNVEWENGSIVIKDDTSYIKLCLDNFPEKRRMFTSASVYAEHLVWEDDWIVKDESYTHLGEYEMINEYVYLYPYTLFNLIDYLELDIQKKDIQFIS